MLAIAVVLAVLTVFVELAASKLIQRNQVTENVATEFRDMQHVQAAVPHLPSRQFSNIRTDSDVNSPRSTSPAPFSQSLNYPNNDVLY